MCGKRTSHNIFCVAREVWICGCMMHVMYGKPINFCARLFRMVREIEMLVGFGLVRCLFFSADDVDNSTIYMTVLYERGRSLSRISPISPAFSFVRSFVQQTFFVMKNIATLLLLLLLTYYTINFPLWKRRALLYTIILILIFTRDEQQLEKKSSSNRAVAATPMCLCMSMEAIGMRGEAEAEAKVK